MAIRRLHVSSSVKRHLATISFSALLVGLIVPMPLAHGVACIAPTQSTLVDGGLTYTVQTFTSVQSNCTWTIPSGVTAVGVLIVGGGGGAGFGSCGGGGGAGSVVVSNSTLSVSPGQSISLTVGGGGIGGFRASDNWQAGTQGESSSVTISGTTYSAQGGGRGGGSSVSYNGGSGGSGGGGTACGNVGTGGSAGSASIPGFTIYANGGATGSGSGGGGGGAGGNTTTSNGGSGRTVWNVMLAAGGGGWGNGTGGSSIGGSATGSFSTKAASGTAGAAGTGSGGGGGNDGGSGRVAIRYIIDTTAPTLTAATLLSSGNQIQLTYNETLSTTAPNPARFTVNDSGTATLTPTSAVFADSRTVTLSLSSTIAKSRTVTVSYETSTATGGAVTEDLALNDAAPFTNSSVTNNSSILNRLATPTTLALLSAETNTATFIFTNTTNASSHTLRIYESATSTLRDSATSFISGATQTGLTPATEYYATLQAIGDGITYESSTASAPMYFTTAIRKPVISTQPVDSTTTLFTSTIFTVSATSPDSGTLSYQWQRSIDAGINFIALSNGGSISGATTATLTITTPALSESGNRFRVVVTNTKVGVVSSETSNVVVLTVTKVSQSALVITSATVVYGETLTISTTGGSGSGLLSATVTSGSCSITGMTLTPTSTGSCTITATRASDSNYLTETSTVTTITITAGSATASISFASTTFTFGVTNTITITTSTAGTVSFKANGKIIKYCKSRATVTAGSITATCSYRPSTRRPISITATLTPTDANISPKVSTSSLFQVVRRTGARG